jgi:hypothetical protein
MLVINSLLSILSIGLPVARKHGKITVHTTFPHNMDAYQQYEGNVSLKYI